MKLRNRVIFFLHLALGWSSVFAETHVTVPAHSSVSFSVRNVFARVTGGFKAATATIDFSPEDAGPNRVTAEIEVASIDTGEKKRDAHLQQPEFFDAAKHPRIVFQSIAWKKSGTNEFEVSGTLAIRGVIKPVILKVRGPDPSTSPDRLRWEASTKINRHDFGVSAYSRMIGAEVEITIKLETVQR